MTLEITLNIVISFLLAITVILGIKLGKRINAFNKSKEELSKFLIDFDSSIVRAEKNINELKATGTQVDENLKSQIKKARFLANDLSFLSEKGENVASTLEDKISMSRDMYRKVMTAEPARNSAPSRPSNPSLNTETALPQKTKSPDAPKEGNTNKKNALDDLLRQIAKKREEVSQ